MKKILCMLLACMLCVSTLGGCGLSSYILHREDSIEGAEFLNDLNDFPEISKKKEILFDAIDTELSKNGFIMTDVEHLIAYMDVGPTIAVYYSSGEIGSKDFVFTLNFDVEDSEIKDLSVSCKKSILNDYPNLFTSVSKAVLCSSAFTFSESDINNFIVAKGSWDLQAYELNIKENDEYMMMSLEQN